MLWTAAHEVSLACWDHATAVKLRICLLQPDACVGGSSDDDAMALILRGAENRRVSETRMNRESSRSHSVFTCTLESSTRNASGITSIRFSRLNIIDLAGLTLRLTGLMPFEIVLGFCFIGCIQPLASRKLAKQFPQWFLQFPLSKPCPSDRFRA